MCFENSRHRVPPLTHIRASDRRTEQGGREKTRKNVSNIWFFPRALLRHKLRRDESQERTKLLLTESSVWTDADGGVALFLAPGATGGEKSKLLGSWRRLCEDHAKSRPLTHSITRLLNLYPSWSADLTHWATSTMPGPWDPSLPSQSDSIHIIFMLRSF